MSIPKKIKIARISDYYTHYIGKTPDGSQFMALIVATLPRAFVQDWEHQKRWYAVLHLFTEGGYHVMTESHFCGVTADGEVKVGNFARKQRNKMLKNLGPIIYSDIEVRLFSKNIDGHDFGLFDVTSEYDGLETVRLMPNDFIFRYPWDGIYDT